MFAKSTAPTASFDAQQNNSRITAYAGFQGLRARVGMQLYQSLHSRLLHACAVRLPPNPGVVPNCFSNPQSAQHPCQRVLSVPWTHECSTCFKTVRVNKVPAHDPGVRKHVPHMCTAPRQVQLPSRSQRYLKQHPPNNAGLLQRFHTIPAACNATRRC
jgi:hypothetical protein